MESSLLSAVILPFSLFVIMLGMGLSLRVDDFKRVFVYPKAVLVGFVAQIFALPLIGFACATLFQLEPVYAVGLIILAASAGGATSNMFTYLAKGDTALSVTLTAFSTCVTVVSLPILVNLALKHFMGEGQEFYLPIPRTVLTLFVITLIPVMIGMFVCAKAPNFSARVEPFVRKLAVAFFVGVVFATVFQERAMLTDSFAKVGPVTYLMNVITMVFGYYIAMLFKLEKSQRNTISIEVGVQNGTTAIFVASTLLANGAMAIPAAIYSLLMFLNVGIFIFLVTRK